MITSNSFLQFKLSNYLHLLIIYVDVMVRNLSCPAVSQIWSLTLSSLTFIVLILKSTPIVVIYDPICNGKITTSSTIPCYDHQIILNGKSLLFFNKAIINVLPYSNMFLSVIFHMKVVTCCFDISKIKITWKHVICKS